MKKSIKKKDKGLEIKISEIESNQDSLLNNFQLCQQGKCDCPTNEYSKLKNLEIESSEDEIILNLKPKSGQSFNKNEVEKCVNFVVDKVSKNKTSNKVIKPILTSDNETVRFRSVERSGSL